MPAGAHADVATVAQRLIADAGSRLSLGCITPAIIQADLRLIQQLLVNLLDNVALHTPPGTQAVVALAVDGAHALLTITDNCPGIALGQCDRVIRPFERDIPPADSPAPSGSGLDLAIAQTIMRIHYGTLELIDNRPGLPVRLRFPLAGSIVHQDGA